MRLTHPVEALSHDSAAYSVVGDLNRSGTVNSRDLDLLINDTDPALAAGQLSSGSGGTDNIIGYAGYIFNAEIHTTPGGGGGGGLYTVRHRHYSPELGRWLTRDPIGFVDGMNLYEYVRSNPTRGIDPTGLAVIDYVYLIDGYGQSGVGAGGGFTIMKQIEQRNRGRDEVRVEHFPYPWFRDRGRPMVRKVMSQVGSDYCRMLNQRRRGPCDTMRISLMGWSMGAVDAVTVTENLRSHGCECPTAIAGQSSNPKPTVHWLGIIDAVHWNGPWTVRSGARSTSHAIKTYAYWEESSPFTNDWLLFPTSKVTGNLTEKILGSIAAPVSHARSGWPGSGADTWLINQANRVGVPLR